MTATSPATAEIAMTVVTATATIAVVVGTAVTEGTVVAGSVETTVAMTRATASETGRGRLVARRITEEGSARPFAGVRTTVTSTPSRKCHVEKRGEGGAAQTADIDRSEKSSILVLLRLLPKPYLSPR
jgi:hypothetical protein